MSEMKSKSEPYGIFAGAVQWTGENIGTIAKLVGNDFMFSHGELKIYTDVDMRFGEICLIGNWVVVVPFCGTSIMDDHIFEQFKRIKILNGTMGLLLSL